MSCGTIQIGSGADCDNLPVAGTKARAVVFNYDEVTGYMTDSEGTVISISLASGAVGYEFVGYRNDVKNSQEVVKPDTGISQFRHLFGMTIYERTQQQKNNVERLSRGTFVIIVENLGLSPISFEVLGLDVGLEIVSGPVRDAYENSGNFVLSFATPEES